MRAYVSIADGSVMAFVLELPKRHGQRRARFLCVWQDGKTLVRDGIHEEHYERLDALYARLP